MAYGIEIDGRELAAEMEDKLNQRGYFFKTRFEVVPGDARLEAKADSEGGSRYH